MKKIYPRGKLILFSILLIAFSFDFQKVHGQTCTNLNIVDCGIAAATTDLCANFLGNAITSINNTNLVFTGTPTATTTKLSFTSRTYTVTATDGCVVVSFTEASTATVSSTDITITTNTGATVTCPNVSVGIGGVICVKICDPVKLPQGTLITVGLEFNATTNFTPPQTVTVTSFATAGVATCTLPLAIPCPSAFVGLNNDCGPSCDAAFPLSNGKIRVFFSQPIPIGEPTPLITALTAIDGVATVNQYKFCLTSDAGTTVQRTFADYCIYTAANVTPLLLTGSLTLTLQSGTVTSGLCVVNVCGGG
jgi:hypothetical protein